MNTITTSDEIVHAMPIVYCWRARGVYIKGMDNDTTTLELTVDRLFIARRNAKTVAGRVRAERLYFAALAALVASRAK